MGNFPREKIKIKIMKKHLVTTKIGDVEFEHIVEVQDGFLGDFLELVPKIKDITVRKYVIENGITNPSDLPEVSYWTQKI